MKKVALVIARQSFRDEEYFHPKEVLEKNGITVVTASSAKGVCTGKLGAKAHAEISLEEVKPEDYDGIFFVGGPGSQEFFHDSKAHEIAAKAVMLGKLYGAICAGPAVLAFAGLLKGKKATSFSGRREELVNNGAIWTGKSVEIDGKLITADGPDSAYAFGEAIAKALK